MFVTFDGIECSGKDTQIEFLKVCLPDALFIREPGSTDVGEAARDLIMRGTTDETTRLFLFAAARSYLTGTIILPALMEKKLVISNRYADSTIAYQMFGTSMPVELIAQVNRAATFGLEPDLTIYLNISVDEMFRRLSLRKDGNIMDRYDRKFYQRVKDGYDMLALMNKRIVTINGEQPAEQIHALIVAELEKRGVLCH